MAAARLQLVNIMLTTSYVRLDQVSIAVGPCYPLGVHSVKDAFLLMCRDYPLQMNPAEINPLKATGLD